MATLTEIRQPISARQLREVLSYSPDTGAWMWLANKRGGRAEPGAAAGSLTKNGYVRITIDGRTYLAHRLAWLWMTGNWPVLHVDHIDRNKTNNKWANLREATKAQNAANSGLSRANKSGIKGVRYNPKIRKWVAEIRRKEGREHLGCFADPADAAHAYASASIETFGEFAGDR